MGSSQQAVMTMFANRSPFLSRFSTMFLHNVFNLAGVFCSVFCTADIDLTGSRREKKKEEKKMKGAKKIVQDNGWDRGLKPRLFSLESSRDLAPAAQGRLSAEGSISSVICHKKPRPEMMDTTPTILRALLTIFDRNDPSRGPLVTRRHLKDPYAAHAVRVMASIDTDPGHAPCRSPS